jgi:hypothetical protein
MHGDDAEGAVALAARTAKPMKAAYVREASVEGYLRSEAKKRAGQCMLEKHVSPGKRGVPDDLMTWGAPLCLMELIETKAPTGTRKGHQVRDHNERQRYGIKVHTLYTRADVDEYFRVHDSLMSLT